MSGNKKKLVVREKRIVRVSAVGIALNVALAVVKALLGLITGSIAITSDAVNNLTDSASSIITIIGTKLAGKPPTKDHPFGYGRIEYITSVIIGVILLYTGIQMLVSSVKKISDPEPVSYSVAVLAAIGLTILAKIFLSWYTKKAGVELDSGALRASGDDARNDVLVSALTLVSAFVYMLTGISIDAWAGAVISIFIIKTGCDVFVDMHGHFLGQRADQEIADIIYRHTLKCPFVEGANGLILHDYGHDRIAGSIDIEVDHNVKAGDFYPTLKELQQHLLKVHNAYIVFGINAVNSDHPEYIKVKNILQQLLEKNSHVIGYHGIDADASLRMIMCDIILDFECDREEIAGQVTEKLRSAFPEYTVYVNVDSEYA